MTTATEENVTSGLVDSDLEVLCCPGCGGDLQTVDASVICSACNHAFETAENGIPQLFWPNDWEDSKADVTERMKAFYEETPFPNYDDFDDVGSLIQKSRQGLFAKLLDDQIPFGVRVLECGCGTGQLTNFLSVANRRVYGADLCFNSLSLAQDFKQKNELERAVFMQMNLFKPCFKKGSMDMVISNGVLHHTSDPFLSFKTIGELVKPGGYIMIGLYHRYGRLFTDFRRVVFGLTRNRFKWLDPRTLDKRLSAAKREAWFMDQYKNPHESKHTIGEVLHWFEETGFQFIKAIPKPEFFDSFGPEERLFYPGDTGRALERFLVELSMIREGGREGGFFTMIGKKTVAD